MVLFIFNEIIIEKFYINLSQLFPGLPEGTFWHTLLLLPFSGRAANPKRNGTKKGQELKEETKRLGNPKTSEWLPEKSRNNSALGHKGIMLGQTHNNVFLMLFLPLCETIFPIFQLPHGWSQSPWLSGIWLESIHLDTNGVLKLCLISPDKLPVFYTVLRWNNIPMNAH